MQINYKLKKKIPDTSNFVKKLNFNAKISETEGKIPSSSGLATTSALTAVENKIPSVVNLVCEIEQKVTDYKHEKYITTSECNKLTEQNFSARLAQANLITKTDFDTKLSSLNRKITSNKTRH